MIKKDAVTGIIRHWVSPLVKTDGLSLDQRVFAGWGPEFSPVMSHSILSVV